MKYYRKKECQFPKRKWHFVEVWPICGVEWRILARQNSRQVASTKQARHPPTSKAIQQRHQP